MSVSRILRETWNGYNKHRIGDLAAMLTYYTIFALFPFAILTVTITLLVLPRDVLQDGFKLVAIALPGPVAAMAVEQMKRMEEAAGGGFAVVGAALALWGASRGAIALQTALNEIHEVKETRPWWKVQLVAITVTIGVTVLIFVALGLLVVGPTAGHWLTDRFGLGEEFEVAWTLGRWLGAAVLVMLVWACLYYFLPNIKRRFRWVTPGAIVGVVLWLAVSRAFILYADNFASYDKTYGALGAVIIFLTWLWLSCMSLLIGGEIDDAIDEVRKKKEPAGEIPEPQQAAFPVTPEVGRMEVQPAAPEPRPHPSTQVFEAGERDSRGSPQVPAPRAARGRLARFLAREPRAEISTSPSTGSSVGDMVKRVGDDFAELARSHFELARVELRSGMKRATADGAAVILGGIVALFGLALLCVSVIAAAEPLMPLWLRLVLGALLYMGIGAALIYVFVKRLRGEPLGLQKTRKEIDRTAQVLKEQVQDG